MQGDHHQPHPGPPAGASELISKAVRTHVQKIGRPAQTVAVAPGRVNLIGEHTDYSGGFVLPLAIDRWTVVTLSPAANSSARVIAGDLEGGQEAVIDLSRPLDAARVRRTQPPWMSYIAGVIEHTRRHAQRNDAQAALPAFDMTVTSTVPLGAGLSSSAALEIAVAAGLSQALNLNISALDLAHIGRRAEHEFAGVPCGVMDQYISAMGQLGHALLIDCRADTARPVPLPPAAGGDGVSIVLVNSNVRHALPDGGYAVKVNACRDAAQFLNVPQLRDATDQMLHRSRATMPADQLAAATHVVGENKRVLAAVHAVEQAHTGATSWAQAMEKIGPLLLQSHASLRDVYKVSCPELDTLVRLSMDVPGVHGARMTGAGFGGSIVALVRTADVERYASHVGARYRAETGTDCTVHTVRASAGATAMSR